MRLVVGERHTHDKAAAEVTPPKTRIIFTSKKLAFFEEWLRLTCMAAMISL
jgi:hypothetical protein